MVLTKSTVEIEKEETVKLDFAPTPEANPNDADMVKGYGVRFVKGDGLEEDTGVEYPVKPSNSDTVWINSGYEANPDDTDIVKDHGVRFIKEDGLEAPSKDTVEIDEEEIVKQDFALINWVDGKKEETLSLVTENVLKARTEFPEVVIDTGCTGSIFKDTEETEDEGMEEGDDSQEEKGKI